MSQNDVPDFNELLRAAQRSAVHLEMRDTYGVGDEEDGFDRFRTHGEVDLDPDSPFWAGWTPTVRETVARGVRMRRARIVSEPVTDYIRWEHAQTPVNIAVGEDVRWLPRRQASDIALPGNDFWLFDRDAVLFNHFAGDGSWDEPRWTVTRDPQVIRLCAEAFETVWERAVPHEKYTV